MGKSDKKKYKPGPPKTVICPYPNCLEEFPLMEMLFTGDSGESVPVRKIFKNKLKRIFKGGNFLLEYPTDSRGNVLRDKQCPRCKRILPYTSGEQTDLIIALIGAKTSGKSHYVAALINRLKTEVCMNFNAGMIHIDEATYDRYYHDFYEPLFGSKMELEATDSGITPLLYNLTVNGSLWGRNQRNRSATLVFYDTAGENFANQENLKRMIKYLSRAAGLIFLIDSLQIEAVRQLIGNSDKLPPAYLEGMPDKILSDVISYAKFYRLITPEGKMNIPVAMTFTKCDVLRKLNGVIEKDRVWNKNTVHKHFYSLSYHSDTYSLFHDLISKWDRKVLNNMNAFLNDYALFGISATGCSSDASGRFPSINPFRVEDPLLWLLYKLGIIPGKRS